MGNINRKWLTITILCNLIIVVACLVPIPPQAPQPFTRTDLVVHVTSYAFLSLISYPTRIRVFFLAIFFIAQGILIEIIQPYVGRHFEWLDILANTGGTLFGLVIIFILKKLKSPAQ